ncbi:MAG: transcription antitermination protein NusB [Synechococcaceae bacterium WB8_3_299]|nr:transcription antitermination protein NusB [Synechococcaceae bacterium WB5_2A_257]NDA74755.1 transcription antitermination protein NusB [Synechococcaceae bacterium WB8_3_299]
MQNRSIARELALLILGQKADRTPSSCEQLLAQALTSLNSHLREALDQSADQLQQAQQALLDSELSEGENDRVRQHLHRGLESAEQVLNRLSASLEFPRLLLLADQQDLRLWALERSKAVFAAQPSLDSRIDAVMEGWRLTRLPRIDQDILRLAVVEIEAFQTPTAVAINEAVELANRYSDEAGRRKINGVLRRYITASTELAS